MKKTNDKGFSLVELIVVIAILAVLTVVTAPSFFRYIEKSRNSADVQNAVSIVNAVQIWSADAKIDNKNDMLKHSDGEYTITVTQDSFTANDAPIKAALINAGLMNEDGSCDIRCESQTKITQYKITFSITENGSLTIKYNPAWIGGSNSTT